MTRRNAQLAGWAAIAAATALLFALDAMRMVNFYFNWFVAILLAVSAVMIAIVVALAGGPAAGRRHPTQESRRKTGRPERPNPKSNRRRES